MTLTSLGSAEASVSVLDQSVTACDNEESDLVVNSVVSVLAARHASTTIENLGHVRDALPSRS